MTDHFQKDTPTESQLITEKLTDAEPPGCEPEFDPAEAERAGAFQEDAITESEAVDSTIDQPLNVDDGIVIGQGSADDLLKNPQARISHPSETSPELQAELEKDVQALLGN